MDRPDPDLIRPAAFDRGPAAAAAAQRSASAQGADPIAPGTIAPAVFQPPGATPRSAAAADSRIVPGRQISTRTLLVSTAAVLALVALLVWLMTTLRLDPAPAAVPATAMAPPEAGPAARPTGSAATPAAPATQPWDDPALLSARAEAQQQAQAAESRLQALQTAGAERWAATDWQTLQGDAAAARAAFDRGAYADAGQGWQRVLAGLDALDAERERQLTQARSDGDAAVDRGDAAAARAAYDRALAIAPDDARARAGRSRAERLPAVLERLQAASAAEARGDGRAAVSAWREALTLDPDTRVAREGIARLEGAQASARFQRTLADALAALDAGRLDDAARALKSAAAQRPGDAAVGDAQRRLEVLRQTQRLAALEADARAAEQAEDWAAAVRHHEALLALDPSLVVAQDGLARTRPRAALASRLAALLATPERLNSAAVFADAEAAFREARAITPAGPKLQAQITALDQALAAASTPVPVELRSDQQTEVTIWRVGPQGRFATKQLRLKPGRYTIVGARSGYIDVQLELQVEAGQPPAPVTIRCTERL